MIKFAIGFSLVVMGAQQDTNLGFALRFFGGFLIGYSVSDAFFKYQINREKLQ